MISFPSLSHEFKSFGLKGRPSSHHVLHCCTSTKLLLGSAELVLESFYVPSPQQLDAGGAYKSVDVPREIIHSHDESKAYGSEHSSVDLFMHTHGLVPDNFRSNWNFFTTSQSGIGQLFWRIFSPSNLHGGRSSYRFPVWCPPEVRNEAPEGWEDPFSI